MELIILWLVLSSFLTEKQNMISLLESTGDIWVTFQIIINEIN